MKKYNMAQNVLMQHQDKNRAKWRPVTMLPVFVVNSAHDIV